MSRKFKINQEVSSSLNLKPVLAGNIFQRSLCADAKYTFAFLINQIIQFQINILLHFLYT